jgi:predicted PurR-regulated permease PerM
MTEKESRLVKIEISPKTLIYVFLFFLGLWFFSQIKAILLLFFVSFILVSALSPAVEFLTVRKISRTLSVVLVYLTLISLIFLLGVAVIPLMTAQTRDFLCAFPLLVQKASEAIGPDKRLLWERYAQGLINGLSSEFIKMPGQALKTTMSIAQSVFAFFSILVISFYLLLERTYLYRGLVGLFPLSFQKSVEEIIVRLEKKLGAWVRGQVFLGFAVGIVSYFGLLVLGVGFALPLAIIAGILELVPTIGPILSAIPAILVALTTSSVLALLVAGLYILIQQFENNFLIPQVMKKTVGVNPLITILALMVGGTLMGVIGVLLAVPVVGVLTVLGQEIMKAVYDAAD